MFLKFSCRQRLFPSYETHLMKRMYNARDCRDRSFSWSNIWRRMAEMWHLKSYVSCRLNCRGLSAAWKSILRSFTSGKVRTCPLSASLFGDLARPT